MTFNWFHRKGQSIVSASTRRGALMEVLENRQLMSASGFAALDVSNDTGSAISLGTINKAKVAKTETIGATDDTADFYTFTVTEKTTLSVKLAAKGKIAKQVQPILALTNTLGESAVTKSPRAVKHIVGAGTYYVSVSGLPAGGEEGVSYKLNVVTKAAAAKKAATFEDQPTNNGGGTGTNGGTFTGTLVNAFTNPAPNAAVHQWEYVATQTGSFELPVSFSADTSWSAVAFNNSTETTGGGGLGIGDGTLTVTATAGQKYVFSILYGGQTSTNYSITFDASFSQLKRSDITQ